MEISSHRLKELFDTTYSGYCKHCDDITTTDGVEPDAQDYECPECGNDTLMGLSDAVLLGFVKVSTVKISRSQNSLNT